MYLSRMELDLAKRETMKALTSPNLFHGAVEHAFPIPDPNTRKRNLWRIDTLRGKTYLMILSEEKPELSRALDQFGQEANVPGWETLDYTPLLHRISAGSRWHFRLNANPVKAVKAKDGERDSRGTVCAHVTVDQQLAWLAEHAERNGFSLNDGEYTVVRSEWLRFCKGAERAKPVTIRSVTFEGILTVTDAELFRGALTAGIGKGKAFGLGLLTVAR